MKAVDELLRDADPLRHEPPVGAEERDRIRRVVLNAGAEPAARPVLKASLSWVVALVILAIVIAAVGSRTRFGGNGTLHAAVRFEVRLADTEPASDLIETRVAGQDATLYLDEEPVVTNEDISQTRVLVAPDGRAEIAVTFTADGAEKMRVATAGHIGRPLAILIDDQLVAAPVIRSAISKEARITGNFTKAEAERIANGMLVP